MCEITEEQTVTLMQMLIEMGLQKKEILEIAAAMETRAKLHLFLEKLSERNFKMTPDEVYEATIDVMTELRG